MVRLASGIERAARGDMGAVNKAMSTPMVCTFCQGADANPSGVGPIRSEKGATRNRSYGVISKPGVIAKDSGRETET